ncbi:hypothetical protein H7X87_02725 [Acetobacteraceae bacterium]|nr:hypothetical protein [Candidatus Parcubacteria bacterium]
MAPVGTAWFPSGRQSLTAELAELGIPTLSKELVRKHKRKMLADTRYGAGRYLWPLSTLVWATTRTCFRTFWRCVAVLATLMLGMFLLNSEMAPLLGSIMVAGAGFAFAALGTLIFLGGLILLLSALDRIRYSHRRFEGIFDFIDDVIAAASYWHPVSLKWAVDPLRMPVPLQFRARDAAEISGVRVVVLALDDDPIVEARRGLFGWQREYIGAWATGVPELDNA